MFTIRHMYATDRILTFSFPMGQWLGARVRLSILMPVVLLAVIWRLDVVGHPSNFFWALVAGAVILYSVLLHELAHVLAARMTGGDAEDVILWPLGGLVAAQPGPGVGSAFWTTFAGPASNLLVAVMCMPPLYSADALIPLLNPFPGFAVENGATLGLTSLRIAFSVNWCLALVNLIPLVPLDAGHALRSFLSLRFTDMESRDLMLRLGLVASLLGLLIGFVMDVSSIAALSAFVLILHIHEAMRSHQAPAPTADESFRGYDFSEGYTSLENSSSEWPDAAAEVPGGDFSKSGILERWRARRDEERQRRLAEEKQRDDRQLDGILVKLHTHGREALDAAELSVLDRVSQRLRQRNENASA